MTIRQGGMSHAVESTNLADLLERVLDKGVVIMGDIKINLLDIELLTIQIRLLICSVDKAREMGVDWWSGNSTFGPSVSYSPPEVAALQARIDRLEAALEMREQVSPAASGISGERANDAGFAQAGVTSQ